MITCFGVVCFNVYILFLGFAVLLLLMKFLFCFPYFISRALSSPATNIVIIGERQRKREAVAVLAIATVTNTKT